MDALRSLVKNLVTKLAHQDAETEALREEITRLKGHHGRQARDMFLGLLKTCQKLGVSFFEYPGDRLRVAGAPTVQPLTLLVSQT